MKQVKILSGFHSITTQIRLNSSSLYEIYIDEGRTDGRVQDLLKLIKQYEIKYHLTSKDRLDGFVKSGKHQGVIAKIHELKTKYVTTFRDRIKVKAAISPVKVQTITEETKSRPSYGTASNGANTI